MKLLACACIAIALLPGCVSQDPETVVEYPYPYHHPLVSPGTQFGGLPPAVQNTVRAQVGGADVYQIVKTSDPAGTVYVVTFQDSEIYPPLYVGADGSVLYPDMRVAVGAPTDVFGAVSGGAVSGLKFSDLPINVAKTVQQKAPTAEVAFINKVTVADKVAYEIKFKDPVRHPEMLIAEDGTLLGKGY